MIPQGERKRKTNLTPA